MKRAGKSTVALADVARVAGVSTATVSLALQEGSRISAATRERVFQAIAETGYRYNRIAAKLRTGHSQTVGLLITDIANPYFASLAAGVETELDAHGYMTFLVNSNDDCARQARQLDNLLEHGVDGILLSPAENTDAAAVGKFVAAGAPVVQVARWLPGLPCDAVGPNNTDLAAEATRHLISLGHRRIAFLGGSSGRSARVERLAGYARALAEADLPCLPELTPMASPTRAEGARLLEQVLGGDDPPTAALCYNDLMALGALRAAAERGLRVGRDFAIIGFDDIQEASLSDPPLTTVHIDAESIGRAAAKRLLARMRGEQEPPKQVVIPTHLVVRDSCGGASRRLRKE